MYKIKTLKKIWRQRGKNKTIRKINDNSYIIGWGFVLFCFVFYVFFIFFLAITGGLSCCQNGGLLRLRLFLLLVQLLDGLYFFFQLHPSVLEPYLDLSLGQAQCVCHLYPPPARQVMIGVKLFLQLKGLVSGVRLSTTAPEPVCSWKKKTNTVMSIARHFLTCLSYYDTTIDMFNIIHHNVMMSI